MQQIPEPWLEPISPVLAIPVEYIVNNVLGLEFKILRLRVYKYWIFSSFHKLQVQVTCNNTLLHRNMRSISVFGFVAFVLFHQCVADVYLHFPPGSNNRLNGNRVNVRNANRLFDSQVSLESKAFTHWPCRHTHTLKKNSNKGSK